MQTLTAKSGSNGYGTFLFVSLGGFLFLLALAVLAATGMSYFYDTAYGDTHFIVVAFRHLMYAVMGSAITLIWLTRILR